jgi:hypothetical protein
LRVRLHPVDRDSAGVGFLASRLEVLGCDVQRNNLGSGLRRTDRDVSGAGGYVEHTLTGGDSTRLDDDRTDLPHLLPCEPVVVAQPPDGTRRSYLIRRQLRPPFVGVRSALSLPRSI